MNNFEITINGILLICGGISVIIGAYMAVKKALEPITKMKNDIDENKRDIIGIKECIADDTLKKDMSIVLKMLLNLLLHAETGNCTGDMKKAKEELQGYIIKRGE